MPGVSATPDRKEEDMTQKANILTTLTGLLAFNGFLGSAFVAPAWAQSTPGSQIAFPMIGVGVDQIFQLNVIVNGCLATLTIVDSAGIPVEPPTTIGSMSTGAGAGKIMFNPFPIEHGFGRSRAELRAIVSLPPATTQPCRAQATAEVFNADSRNTTLILPGLVPPGPSQVPPGPIKFGPIGLGFRQTVRLNVVAFPPNPCFGVITFTDTQGSAVGGASPVTLAAGQATFLDLPGETVVADRRQRGEIIATFTQTVGAAPGACIASVEVFDQESGWTRVLIPPGPQT
jgi:hypothetical protein